MITKRKNLPITAPGRNAVWAYPQIVLPRFRGAPAHYELRRSHDEPCFEALPHEADLYLELYGGQVNFWLDGAMKRIFIRRFEFISYSCYSEALAEFVCLWREIEQLEMATEVKQSVEEWFKARHKSMVNLEDLLTIMSETNVHA